MTDFTVHLKPMSEEFHTLAITGQQIFKGFFKRTS